MTFLQRAFINPLDDTLSYSYEVSPTASWLNFETDTLTFDGTPNINTDAMEYTVTVKASNSVATG